MIARVDKSNIFGFLKTGDRWVSGIKIWRFQPAVFEEWSKQPLQVVVAVYSECPHRDVSNVAMA